MNWKRKTWEAPTEDGGDYFVLFKDRYYRMKLGLLVNCYPAHPTDDRYGGIDTVFPSPLGRMHRNERGKNIEKINIYNTRIPTHNTKSV